jgi:hypothetical protein
MARTTLSSSTDLSAAGMSKENGVLPPMCSLTDWPLTQTVQ